MLHPYALYYYKYSSYTKKSEIISSFKKRGPFEEGSGEFSEPSESSPLSVAVRAFQRRAHWTRLIQQSKEACVRVSGALEFSCSHMGAAAQLWRLLLQVSAALPGSEGASCPACAQRRPDAQRWRSGEESNSWKHARTAQIARRWACEGDGEGSSGGCEGADGGRRQLPSALKPPELVRSSAERRGFLRGGGPLRRHPSCRVRASLPPNFAPFCSAVMPPQSAFSSTRMPQICVHP